MKIISSVFEYPGYAEAWDHFAKVSNRLLRRLRKAGIPDKLQDELVRAVAELTRVEADFDNDMYIYKKYRYPALPPELIAATLEFMQPVEEREEF